MVSCIMVRAVCILGLLCLVPFLSATSATYVSRNNFPLSNFGGATRDVSCRSIVPDGGVINLTSGQRRLIGCYEYTCPASGLMHRRKVDGFFRKC